MGCGGDGWVDGDVEFDWKSGFIGMRELGGEKLQDVFWWFGKFQNGGGLCVLFGS